MFSAPALAFCSREIPFGPSADLPAMTVQAASDIILRKLKAHSSLAAEDEALIRSLTYRVRQLSPMEDLVRQGDAARVSAAVIQGVLARYHTLFGGKRQYLSFHLPGDWPDA